MGKFELSNVAFDATDATPLSVYLVSSLRQTYLDWPDSRTPTDHGHIKRSFSQCESHRFTMMKDAI